MAHESFMTLREPIKWKTKEAVLVVHSERLDQSSVGQMDSSLCGILIWASESSEDSIKCYGAVVALHIVKGPEMTY